MNNLSVRTQNKAMGIVSKVRNSIQSLVCKGRYISVDNSGQGALDQVVFPVQDVHDTN